ncbi:hypothetical protein, partial [Aestuariivirga sp.]|uniref:hypothetical protein n=1 Tax=Aestuariivirga sp. TaxID=2650926 RepID=UPI003593ABAD
MQQLGYTRGLELFRPFWLGALLVTLVMLLASCSAGSILTDSTTSEQRGKTVPPVTFQEITGLPPAKLSQMQTALVVAGGNRDIGFVEGRFQTGTFALTGAFKAFSDSSGVRVLYQWQLRDDAGVLLQTIDGEDNAGLSEAADPWTVVSSAVVDRIARRTVEDMARKLAQMGYATRLSALTVPPAEYFVAASPDAHREIDFETLNGPGLALAGVDMIAPPDDPQMAVASVDPIPGEAQLVAKSRVPEEPASSAPDEESSQVASAGPKAQPVPEPKTTAKTASKAGKSDSQNAKAGQVEIRAVAVVAVKGSPGGGDAELTAALRKTLIDAGWPVVTKPQPDALTIIGRVKVASKGEASQSVSVRWEVQSPDGKTLGDVKQANDVPRGA